MKNKALSWLSYVSIGIIIQCFVIVQMCNARENPCGQMRVQVRIERAGREEKARRI